MQYLTIDFETANEDYASICQVGVASVLSDGEIKTWGTYINPEDDFSGLNIGIHGITEDDVQDSPTFVDICQELHRILSQGIVLCYGSFDISAFKQVHNKYGLDTDNIKFINVHKMVRRHWKEFARKGFGLADICTFLRIPNPQHHDAINDALLCAKIVEVILKESGKDLAWWQERVKEPIDGTIAQDGINPDGELFGETVLFTGTLSMKRAIVATLAAKAGANVTDNFSRKVTTLVVGNRDIKRNAKKLSAKHLSALKSIEKGGNIKIIKEDDFLSLLESSGLER